MSPSQVETSTVAEPGTTTLRLIADNLPVIVAHVTRDGQYLFVNKKITGASVRRLPKNMKCSIGYNCWFSASLNQVISTGQILDGGGGNSRFWP